MIKKLFFLLFLLAPYNLLASVSQNSTNVYGMVSETYPGLEFEVAKDTFASFSYVPTGASFSGYYIGPDNSSGYYKEGFLSTRFHYRGSNHSNTTAGFYAQFGWVPGSPSAKNMTNFENGRLEFWAKKRAGDKVGVYVGLEWSGGGSDSLGLNLSDAEGKLPEEPGDGQWHFFSIPLYPPFPCDASKAFCTVDLSQVTVPAKFYGKGVFSGLFWIDNVVWKKSGTGVGGIKSLKFIRKDDPNMIELDPFGPIEPIVELWPRLTDPANKSIATGTATWVVADYILKLDVDYYDPLGNPNFVVRIYTDNQCPSGDINPNRRCTSNDFGYTGSTNPAGLVNAYKPDAHPLPMAWHIADSTAVTASGKITMVQGALGVDCMGTGDPQNYPDRLWIKERAPNSKLITGDPCYPAFLWMMDKNSENFKNPSLEQLDDPMYAHAWEFEIGVQHAENTWNGYKSPNYIFLGANFFGATTGPISDPTSPVDSASYGTRKLIIELGYE